MKRLVDRNGMTVEPAVMDGKPQFIVRLPNGILPNAQSGVPYTNPTTPEQLRALGVDLGSLK